MNQSMESMLCFRHCLFLETFRNQIYPNSHVVQKVIRHSADPPRIAFGRHHLFGTRHQLQHNGPGSVPWTVHCCPGRPTRNARTCNRFNRSTPMAFLETPVHKYRYLFTYLDLHVISQTYCMCVK